MMMTTMTMTIDEDDDDDDDDDDNDMQCKQKFEIQDGGRKIGNTFNSAGIQDSCKFSTAIPRILKSTELFKML